MFPRKPRLAIFLLTVSATWAQSFEAASVKPVDPGRPGAGPLRGGPGTHSPGQFAGAATLKALLMRAYELKNYQIAGPAWLDTERYEIAALAPAAELLEPWKDPEHLPAATEAVGRFLRDHTPR